MSKKLVAYFSASGVTAKVADMLLLTSNQHLRVIQLQLTRQLKLLVLQTVRQKALTALFVAKHSLLRKLFLRSSTSSQNMRQRLLLIMKQAGKLTRLVRERAAITALRLILHSQFTLSLALSGLTPARDLLFISLVENQILLGQICPIKTTTAYTRLKSFTDIQISFSFA